MGKGMGLFTVVLMSLAVSGQTPAPRPRDPALDKLDFLLRAWRTANRFLPGPAGPGGESVGQAKYRWGLERSWLVFDFSAEAPQMGNYHVHGLVSVDPASKRYIAYAFNNLSRRLSQPHFLAGLVRRFIPSLGFWNPVTFRLALERVFGGRKPVP